MLIAQAWQACALTPRRTLPPLLGVVLWGLNFLAIDFGRAQVPPPVFLALRFIVVAIPAGFFVKPPGIGWRNVLLPVQVLLCVIAVTVRAPWPSQDARLAAAPRRWTVLRA